MWVKAFSPDTGKVGISVMPVAASTMAVISGSFSSFTSLTPLW